MVQCVTKGVFRGMVTMVRALIAGLEHTYQSQGCGGMASTMMILEIMHTHYWEKEGSSKSDTSNQSLVRALSHPCLYSGLLKQLHWLSVEWRIKFKIACITYKTISTTQPAYLYSSLKRYTPSRTLRSSDSKLLFVPRVRTCFGSRSFAVAAPTIWNFLSLAIRSSVSTYSFRC